MSELVLGEERINGDRFPGLILTLDGKRYRISSNDASQFGRKMNDAARWTVSRVDIDVIREIVATCKLVEIVE